MPSNSTDSSFISSPNPNKTPNVATTFSFAKNPVNVATAACQFPNPNGVKIGAIIRPIEAKILSLASTISSDQLNDCKNQTKPEATKIIVPAL